MTQKFHNDDGSEWSKEQYAALAEYKARFFEQDGITPKAGVDMLTPQGAVPTVGPQVTFKSTGRFYEELAGSGSYVSQDSDIDGAKNKVKVVVNSMSLNNNLTWVEYECIRPDGTVFYEAKAVPPINWKIDNVTQVGDGTSTLLTAAVHTYSVTPRKRDIMEATLPNSRVAKTLPPAPPPAPEPTKGPCGPNRLPYFRPNNRMTRGQVCKVVVGAIGLKGDPGPQMFEDVPPTSPFYAAIQLLAQMGVIGGYSCE